MAVHHHGRRPGAVRDTRPDPEVHEGRRQTGRQQAHAGSRLKPLTSGKAPPDRPAFQPYWGKPAVRNERGDRGNVGIIRSPVRASILPDLAMAAAEQGAMPPSPNSEVMTSPEDGSPKPGRRSREVCPGWAYRAACRKAKRRGKPLPLRADVRWKRR